MRAVEDFVAVAIIALCLVWPPVAFTQIPHSYGGLYVISSPFSGPAYYPLPPSIVSAPQIDGVYISLQWNEIEPSAGAYSWTALDTLLNRSVDARKKIEIGVTGGGRTPAWLYAQGVPEHTFVINLPPKADRCHTVTVPTYWDPRYISAYGTMIRALAAHLHAVPAWYDAVRIVKIGGINMNTEETYIPSQEPISPNPCTNGMQVSDSLPIWQAAGYRPSKIIEAWVQMATAIGREFPDKLLSLDILETNTDFPRIDEQQAVVRRISSTTYVNVMRKLVEKAFQTFSGRIAVQWDALSQLSLAQYAPDVMAAGRQGAVIGWQTNARGGTAVGSLCGSMTSLEPCNNATYQLLLDSGIDNGGRYIEVLPVNVQPFGEALRAAQVRLRGLIR